MKNSYIRFATVAVTVLMLCIVGCGANNEDATKPAYELSNTEENSANTVEAVEEVPAETVVEVPVETVVESKTEFNGQPYTIVNNNVYDESIVPITYESYEFYSELDDLGRCGIAHACVGKDLMPTEERGSIGSVKPSGWQSVKYDCVDGKYLYNRCHLIGYQLTAENANDKNLITGTRYLNVIGMLPFENMVADYIKETNNHVMYVVIPSYSGNNLVADGVYMMAKSVEDEGDGIEFNVFCYNIQPGIHINYEDGTSYEEVEEQEYTENDVNGNDISQEEQEMKYYVINTETHKFHTEDCRYVNLDSNNQSMILTYREGLIEDGYEPCKVCNP